jgi:hypothetical protein
LDFARSTSLEACPPGSANCNNRERICTILSVAPRSTELVPFYLWRRHAAIWAERNKFRATGEEKGIIHFRVRQRTASPQVPAGDQGYKSLHGVQLGLFRFSQPHSVGVVPEGTAR